MLQHAVLCAFLFFVLPQVQSNDPLEITDEGLKPSATSGSGTAISLRIVNRSGHAIDALVLVVDFFDRNGNRHSAASKSMVRGLAPSGGNFAPDETLREEFVPVLAADGQPLNYKVSADYVLFSDASLPPWGLDRTKESLKITGIKLGFRMERSRLRRVLEQRGVNAVADDLQQAK